MLAPHKREEEEEEKEAAVAAAEEAPAEAEAEAEKEEEEEKETDCNTLQHCRSTPFKPLGEAGGSLPFRQNSSATFKAPTLKRPEGVTYSFRNQPEKFGKISGDARLRRSVGLNESWGQCKRTCLGCIR